MQTDIYDREADKPSHTNKTVYFHVGLRDKKPIGPFPLLPHTHTYGLDES